MISTFVLEPGIRSHRKFWLVSMTISCTSLRLIHSGQLCDADADAAGYPHKVNYKADISVYFVCSYVVKQ